MARTQKAWHRRVRGRQTHANVPKCDRQKTHTDTIKGNTQGHNKHKHKHEPFFFLKSHTNFVRSPCYSTPFLDFSFILANRLHWFIALPRIPSPMEKNAKAGKESAVRGVEMKPKLWESVHVIQLNYGWADKVNRSTFTGTSTAAPHRHLGVSGNSLLFMILFIRLFLHHFTIF